MHQSDQILKRFQAQLNYTKEEMEMITANPKFLQVLGKAPQLLSTEFFFDIEKAHGCVVRHQPGERIIVNGDGSLACKEGPPKICVYLLQALAPVIYGAQEFIYAGLDPNDLKFTRVGCFDVGAKCGGLGHVSVSFKSHSI